MSDIQALKDSLVYQMSLGSKELYHSNVWAWLIESDHDFIKVFCFGDDIARRIKKVGREDGNRDLSIYLDEEEKGNAPVIVIENKLKAIPTIKQLEDYQKEVEGRFVAGILTGITLPTIAGEDGFVDVKGQKWKLVKYPEIAARIIEIAEGSKEVLIQKNLSTIREYAENLFHMAAIVKSYDQGTIEPIWDGELDGLGLQDLINKVRGSRFMRHFDARSKEDGLEFPKETFTRGHSFHNKKNTLDFRYVAEDDFLIGIQIEGDQFRRVAQINPKGPHALTEEELFKKFCGEWFDGVFNENKGNKSRCIKWPKTLTPLSTKMTGTHCKYETKEYCFVYQYVTLGKEDMEFSNLYRLLIDNLHLAEELFQKNRQGEAK